MRSSTVKINLITLQRFLFLAFLVHKNYAYKENKKIRKMGTTCNCMVKNIPVYNCDIKIPSNIGKTVQLCSDSRIT